MGVSSEAGPASIVDLAVKILEQGGLVAIPTETVYGLAADASSELAVRRIFAAKGRPQDHPVIVHLGGIELLPLWVSEIPAAAHKLAAANVNIEDIEQRVVEDEHVGAVRLQVVEDRVVAAPRAERVRRLVAIV